MTITDAGREMHRQCRCEVRGKPADLLTTLNNDEYAGLELSARVALPLIDRLINDDTTGIAQRATA